MALEQESTAYSTSPSPSTALTPRMTPLLRSVLETHQQRGHALKLLPWYPLMPTQWPGWPASTASRWRFVTGRRGQRCAAKSCCMKARKSGRFECLCSANTAVFRGPVGAAGSLALAAGTCLRALAGMAVYALSRLPLLKVTLTVGF